MIEIKKLKSLGISFLEFLHKGTYSTQVPIKAHKTRTYLWLWCFRVLRSLFGLLWFCETDSLHDVDCEFDLVLTELIVADIITNEVDRFAIV